MIGAALMFILALSGPQQAPETQQAPGATGEAAAAAPATTPARPDPLDRTVCREEAVVGSRFGSRTCMTQREWNARRDESRRLAQRLGAQQDNAGGRITAPGH